MRAISTTLGSGAIKSVELKDVMHEEWVELLMLDLKIQTSPEFLSKAAEWHCPGGITSQSMKMLNEEFNTYRGLFPLKVFIGGPPVSGKTHFATKLAQGYGIPHLMIADLIQEATQSQTELASEIKSKIEELKDIEIAAYEKTKKKKDPDLDRNTLKPRLPDSILYKIVKAKISSPACLNKGFLLDGFPRKTEDAVQIFLEAQEGEIPEAQQINGLPGYISNNKILPQYVVFFEGEDAFLKQRAKDLPPEARADHHTEPLTEKRLKIYREANPNLADQKHLSNFFKNVIGSQGCYTKIWGPVTDGKTAAQVESQTL